MLRHLQPAAVRHHYVREHQADFLSGSSRYVRTPSLPPLTTTARNPAPDRIVVAIRTIVPSSSATNTRFLPDGDLSAIYPILALE